MYWAILRTGPDELPRYHRVFGAPPDDPTFNRLRALAMDQGGDLEGAHEAWQMYEQEIARNSSAWPGEQANLARALIWLQMGDNAASVPEAEQRKKLPRFLRELEDMPEPLKPGPEACFEKALQLEPKLLDAHAGLFRYHLRAGHTEKAIKAGRRLLELFPDHLQTLEELAELYGQQSKHTEELELLQQALRHNPLDRDLRRRLGNANLARARQLAEKEKIDKARPHYESALSFAEPHAHGVLSCCWAAAEMKAGNQERADELLAQARAKSPGEIMITYVLLVEANRLKLPGAVKTRFTKQFNESVGDKPTPPLALALLEYLRQLGLEDFTYHGLKTHTKKIYDFVDRLDKEACPEESYIAILDHLARMDSPSRMMSRFFDFARDKYPKSPFVPYLEAVHLMGDDPEAGPPTRAAWLLQEAERLGRPRASEPAVKAMLDDVAARLKLLQAFRALMPFGMFGGPLGGFGGFGGFDPFDLFGDDDEDLE
jgi:tetratricopeptide (TPR) repeat protein